ncbi:MULTISPECIES: flagellar basal body-associated FliL family protein [unclassified Duganella]|jgi:flagellar FliL protein|uniref:flagellar basal body-associated FliL family protein n=1 Tax=unclassified Duganella TaxID=2636909 RepID=UPI00088BBE4D|nr:MULTISPECIES: flagellar basal body-associated FliL family protein [unclassified Duganella]SDF68165.1 flagellar FliL protein [Duganella sp. OV458]SDI60963.1 flagellar FliL protein [Duganella sp. OV510]
MKNMKVIIAFVLVAVVGAAVAGGAVWYMSKGGEEHAEESKDVKKKPKKEEKKSELPPKYLTVDKVVVMLRHEPSDNVTHYLSADLVVATDAKREKETKENLPMLRSVAVKTLSNLPMASARVMTIDQFAAELNKAFDHEFEQEGREKPFDEIMIGKLIVE